MTGGAWFIGNYLVDRLVADGFKPRVSLREGLQLRLRERAIYAEE
jgi:hypothetical protein